MAEPTLSVLMTNYNYDRHIGVALEAILSQSYKPLEIIVIDDASTDNSVAVIMEYAKKNPHIKLIKNEKNMGIFYSFERCFKKTKGDYIYPAASDDKILPGFFEKSIALLTKYPQAGLCCSDPVFYEEDKISYFVDNLGLSDKPSYISPEVLVDKLKTKSPMIAGHTAIIKRDSLIKAGGYDADLKWHCDWFAHMVIAFRNGICYLPEPLAQLRLSKTSYSGSERAQNGRQGIKHMFDLFKSSEYEDVLPYFKKSKALARLGWDLIVLTLVNPKYSDLFCFKAFWYALKQAINPLTPWFVKNVYRQARNLRRVSK